MGFGSLINSSAQNALTDLQTSTNTIGAGMQLDSANKQSDALKTEATNAYQTSLVQAGQAYMQGRQAYGQQAEGYASAGVEQVGSPLAMLNSTLMQTSQQVSMLLKQGELQQSLLLDQADMTQDQGMANWLSAEGQNQIIDQQNSLTQAQQKNQLLGQFIGMPLDFLRGGFDAALPTLLNKIMPTP